MDRLLSLSSKSSEISQEYFPPIELDPNYTYALGLYTLNTYNSVPNIIDGRNNRFYFLNEDRVEEIISIPEGAYEIEAIEDVLRNELLNYLKQNLAGKSQKILEETEDRINTFSIKPNINTLKTEIFSPYSIINLAEDSIMKVFGFKETTFLMKNAIHVSDPEVEITTVSEINVECNIVEGSFRNGIPCHTIFTFYPDVSPGYKLTLQPANVIYLPVNTHTINNITLRLTDQNGNLVNFRNEEISIQLNLRRLWA